MKNTRFIATAAACLGFTLLSAQSTSLNPYTPTPNDSNSMEGLIYRVANIEKKTDKFNLYLNMHGDFEAQWRGSDFDYGKFQMRQLRVEMKGDINDWISYRYRQRLNKGDDPKGYYDNVLQSIDVAAVTFKYRKFQFMVGKQCAAYGGIEFYVNPIEVYEYTDMGSNSTNFMTGVDAIYNVIPQQQFHFQILNANPFSTKKLYGDYEKAKMPLLYTVNWNGNFKDVFLTRWSASYMNELLGHRAYYFALGNLVNFTPQLGAYFDFMYSREGVDRRGILTKMIKGDDAERNVANVSYNAFVLHLHYRFLPQWNLFAKGTYERANVYKASGDVPKGNYRTSWGYSAGIEYYPIKNDNLHFFLAYVGRSFRYSDLARSFGNSNYDTNRVSVGFIWQMSVL